MPDIDDEPHIDGERVTYRAINGHLMVADRDAFDRGQTWNAQHSEDCQCHGETLPDW